MNKRQIITGSFRFHDEYIEAENALEAARHELREAQNTGDVTAALLERVDLLEQERRHAKAAYEKAKARGLC